MKPVAYFPILLLIVFAVSTHLLSNYLSSYLSQEEFGTAIMVAWGIGIGLGSVAGFLYQRRNKNYKRLRPIIYWPLIGFLAFIFMKGSMSETWYYAFAFWIGLGLIIGLVIEWKGKKIRGDHANSAKPVP